MASALLLASEVRVPRFFTLEFNENSSYATYVHDGGEMDGCIRFEEINVVSPYTKFEAEASGNYGLFHIRSCENNRYWERNTIQNKGWITATAEKKEGDQTKASCTLFKFISVDAFLKTVRILHVQSGNYLCLSVTDEPTTVDRCASVDNNVLDPQGRDILQLIDRSSLLILPKYVAFIGDNGKYLRQILQGNNRDYLEFSGDDIGDANVVCEVEFLRDGSIAAIFASKGEAWSINGPHSSRWVVAIRGRISHFRLFKVDDTTVGIMYLNDRSFCRRHTADGKTNCLNVGVPSITREARLTVVEPIMYREIYDVQYDVSKSRVYDESVLIVAQKSESNYTQQTITHNMKFAYTMTETTNWKTRFSFKFAIKASVSFRIPLIVNGKVQISTKLESVTEWGKTTTTTAVWENQQQVPVPPMTRTTVDVVAITGKCDVPFTYMQRDTLYDGRTVITKIEGNTFTGSNYYSIDYVTREEKLK